MDDRHFFCLEIIKTKQKKVQDFTCLPQKSYARFSKMLKPQFLITIKNLKQKAFLNENSSLFFGSPAEVVKVRSFEVLSLPINVIQSR
jgi:hypothetical protein